MLCYLDQQNNPIKIRAVFFLPSLATLHQEAGHDASTKPEGPLLLCLTPTRELAIQVAQQCRLLRPLTGLRTECVYGGVPKEGQVGVG